jgi:putative transposase
VWKDLAEDDIRVSRKRVVRLMQEEGLKARARKRFKSTTMSEHDQPVAANLLNREFTAASPNQRWVGDTTEFVIGSSGKLYLAVVLDLFSRFVVGWAVSAINDRHLTLRALEMALKRRRPDIGLLHHSDQGSPYASEDYRSVLEAQGITCSSRGRGRLRPRKLTVHGIGTSPTPGMTSLRALHAMPGLRCSERGARSCT